MTAARLLLPIGLALLAGCAQHSATVSLQEDQQSKCPLQLHDGQTLVLSLPSNPTTGYRWELKDAASQVLRSLGPEVYSNPEDVGLVGGAGLSTWRFFANIPGDGRLLLVYQRPWEADVAPAKSFDCAISVK
ncbi:protease inhibitor I42 family protein [Pseudomonas sp. LS44]|uniref:protease inhibitor I42 family protein n=1 Tax=Pseudomonas sp. LS44 TaxID=1357074 RepID=UPI00215B658C|nr:protease inhibitor I42 family protein [Pseudomonas sp. LS44]UVE18790.1 protease inhibitor I42 family protein [Pseudomonas sp. LS44]